LRRELSFKQGAAAAGHLRPVDISPPGASGSSPALATDGAGSAAAVWRSQDERPAVIFAAVRETNGTDI
jgi:hypothetical protein